MDEKLLNNENAASGIHQKYQNSANKKERNRSERCHCVAEKLHDSDSSKGDCLKNGCFEKHSLKNILAKGNSSREKIDSIQNEAEKSSQEHATLEALEKTKVAVAQFAAAALSKRADESSGKDMTVLQSALFTLQHQQVFQMQLIEQLQFQLAKNHTRIDKKRSKCSQTKSKKDENDSDVQTLETAEDEFMSPIEW